MPRRSHVVGLVVLAGLCVSAATAVFSADPGEPLPGVALGSGLILAVERALALFAAWMFILVVVSRALVGELPIEVTGRGFRYAEAEQTRGTTAQLELAVENLEADLNALRLAALGEPVPSRRSIG